MESFHAALQQLVVSTQIRLLEGTDFGIPTLIASLFDCSWARLMFIMQDGSAVLLDHGNLQTVVLISTSQNELHDVLTQLLSSNEASVNKMFVINDLENISSGLTQLLGREESEGTLPTRSHLAAFTLKSHHAHDHVGDLIMLCGRTWKAFDPVIVER